MQVISTISFRPANFQDIPTLQYWDRQAHVIAAAPDCDWDWEEGLTQDPGWREWQSSSQGTYYYILRFEVDEEIVLRKPLYLLK